MARLDVRAMSLLSVSHLVDDYNQSFIPALLPFLIVQRGISHETAATLVFAQAASSSVIQPGIGILADRVSMPWLIAAGIFMAGMGVAALGWLSSFPLLVCAALLSGIGVACFHPEAARFANYVAGDRKASGMRWFTVGGNLGFAVGPGFATGAIALFGARTLHGTLLAFIPVTIVAIVVLAQLPRLRTFIPDHAERRAGAGTNDWFAFSKLSVCVIVRSMTYLGLVSFVSLYVVERLGVAPAVGDGLLTAFLVAGVAGTLTGGPVADRIGRKPVLVGSTLATAVLVFTIVAIGPAAGLAGVAVLLVLTGFALYTSQAPMVVLGQEYLPNNIGLASGVTLGLAVSLGGMFTPVLGWIADRHGIAASMTTLGGLAIVAFALGMLLPNEGRRAERPAVAA